MWIVRPIWVHRETFIITYKNVECFFSKKLKQNSEERKKKKTKTNKFRHKFISLHIKWGEQAEAAQSFYYGTTNKNKFIQMWKKSKIVKFKVYWVQLRCELEKRWKTWQVTFSSGKTITQRNKRWKRKSSGEYEF